MRQNDLIIRSAHLKTVDKLPDKLLSIGKIENSFESNTFLFFVIEVDSPWMSSAKVKKAICSSLEHSFREKAVIEANFFEKKIQAINDSLDKISRSGENSWIGNLNAAIGFVHENEILATQTGNISGYIFRDSKISSLAEANSSAHAPLPAKTFSEVICGGLKNGDRVVFGNIDLYNHVSLDRLRRLTEKVSAKESNIELFRSLRKEKIKSVNAIFIEASSQTEESDKVLNDIPEILCLDEPTETFLSKAQKDIYPKLKIGADTLGRHIVTVAKAVHFHTKKLYGKSKDKWSSSYGPKTKELLQKSGPGVAKMFGKAKDSVHANLENSSQYKNMKIKTTTYSKMPASKLSLATRSVFDSAKQIFTILFKKENRKYVYLALVLIFLSLGYMKIRTNNVNRDQKKQESEIASAFDKAKEAYDQAKEDLALGKTTSADGLEQALAYANTAKDSPNNKDQAEALMREIQASIDKLNKTTRLYNPTKLFSFNDKTKQVVLAGTDIYGIDSDGKIFTASANDKEPRLVSSIGKDNGASTGLSFSESENKIYIYTDQNKMIAYDLTSKTHAEVTISDTTGKWEDAVAVASFTSNIYLLDSEAGEVWKHTKKDAGYSKGTAYVDTKKNSIRGAVDLAIDGNIFILQNDGSVAKFTKGVKDTVFALSDIPKPGDKIEIPQKIYTDADTNYIYILDSKLDRILRFNKSGAFMNQYALSEMPIDNFMVNNKVGKLWIASDGNIYEVNL